MYEGAKKIVTQWVRLGVDEDNPAHSFNTLGIQEDGWDDEDNDDDEEEEEPVEEDDNGSLSSRPKGKDVYQGVDSRPRRPILHRVVRARGALAMGLRNLRNLRFRGMPKVRGR